MAVYQPFMDPSKVSIDWKGLAEVQAERQRNAIAARQAANQFALGKANLALEAAKNQADLGIQQQQLELTKQRDIQSGKQKDAELKIQQTNADRMADEQKIQTGVMQTNLKLAQDRDKREQTSFNNLQDKVKDVSTKKTLVTTYQAGMGQQVDKHAFEVTSNSQKQNVSDALMAADRMSTVGKDSHSMKLTSDWLKANGEITDNITDINDTIKYMDDVIKPIQTNIPITVKTAQNVTGVNADDSAINKDISTDKTSGFVTWTASELKANILNSDPKYRDEAVRIFMDKATNKDAARAWLQEKLPQNTWNQFYRDKLGVGYEITPEVQTSLRGKVSELAKTIGINPEDHTRPLATDSQGKPAIAGIDITAVQNKEYNQLTGAEKDSLVQNFSGQISAEVDNLLKANPMPEKFNDQQKAMAIDELRLQATKNVFKSNGFDVPAEFMEHTKQLLKSGSIYLAGAADESLPANTRIANLSRATMRGTTLFSTAVMEGMWNYARFSANGLKPFLGIYDGKSSADQKKINDPSADPGVKATASVIATMTDSYTMSGDKGTLIQIHKAMAEQKAVLDGKAIYEQTPVTVVDPVTKTSIAMKDEYGNVRMTYRFKPLSKFEYGKIPEELLRIGITGASSVPKPNVVEQKPEAKTSSIALKKSTDLTSWEKKVVKAREEYNRRVASGTQAGPFVEPKKS